MVVGPRPLQHGGSFFRRDGPRRHDPATDDNAGGQCGRNCTCIQRKTLHEGTPRFFADWMQLRGTGMLVDLRRRRACIGAAFELSDRMQDYLLVYTIRPSLMVQRTLPCMVHPSNGELRDFDLVSATR